MVIVHGEGITGFDSARHMPSSRPVLSSTLCCREGERRKTIQPCMALLGWTEAVDSLRRAEKGIESARMVTCGNFHGLFDRPEANAWPGSSKFAMALGQALGPVASAAQSGRAEQDQACCGVLSAFLRTFHPSTAIDIHKRLLTFFEYSGNFIRCIISRLGVKCRQGHLMTHPTGMVH